MKYCVSAFLLFTTTTLLAQQDSAKAPVYGWAHTMVGGLTLTQVSYTNWAGGGDNALAYAVGLDGKSVNDQEKTTWSTSLKLAFGQTRLGSQGIRKTEDRIDLESVLAYKFGVYVNPYAAATMKTQFAKGFMYDNVGTETQVSQFFDPAFLTQSIGVGYQVIPEVKTRLGAALREVVTSDFNSYADDTTTPEVEKVRIDGGLESVTEVSWKMDDNILFTSKLELFAPFRDITTIVIRNDNTIAAKVSKYITVNFNVQIINEKNVTPRTQVKEALAIGLSYTVL